MGVAVMNRASALRPFSMSRLRWSTPNRCCSSMMTSPQSCATTSSSKSAWVPKTTSVCPEARRMRMSSRSSAGVEPVSSAQLMPAWSKRPPKDAAYWVASTSVGAIMNVWKRASAAAAMANPATAVLPVPTSPSSMWDMTFGCAMRIWISATARSWSDVSEKGSAFMSASEYGPSKTCSWAGPSSWRSRADMSMCICSMSTSS
jgi:hypothetical protein